MVINFISSKDSEEIRTMYTKSDNIEIIIGNKTDEIIEELFESFFAKISRRISEFFFDSVDSLYYKLHKISLNRKWSYADSPKWLRNEKATTNPENNDDTCFQYCVTVALNYQNIEKVSQRISKIKPFIDQYDRKEINFPSNKKD